jgi:hypothetical protein
VYFFINQGAGFGKSSYMLTQANKAQLHSAIPYIMIGGTLGDAISFERNEVFP